MTAKINLYEYVLARLREKVVPQRQVSRESGVPFSTVAKIAQGSVTDPSVHTVQKLYDYFQSREAAVPASENGSDFAILLAGVPFPIPGAAPVDLDAERDHPLPVQDDRRAQDGRRAGEERRKGGDRRSGEDGPL